MNLRAEDIFFKNLPSFLTCIDLYEHAAIFMALIYNNINFYVNFFLSQILIADGLFYIFLYSLN